MKTKAARVTDREQVSIPAMVRKRLNLTSGQRVTGEPVSDHECRMVVVSAARVPGATAMLGYAAKFRRVRRTSEWMADIRQGELSAAFQKQPNQSIRDVAYRKFLQQA
jgi:bifunctional DNA-binding transcriptional regulator/antitoxin component of YhaV-PrlF toxin-antitoxin module